MKRSIMTMIMVTSLVIATKAQEATGGIHIIPRIGVNFYNVDLKYVGQDVDTKIKTGFHVGADVEIPLADEFYIQPGLLFSTKGAKLDENNSDAKINLSYLELPVSFMYKPVLGEGRLLLGVGPYVGIAVGGKVKGDGEDADIEFKSDVDADDFDDTKLYMKRMDFGANLTAGYELSMGVTIQLNAQLGLSNNGTKINNAPAGFDDEKFKNTGFGLSVGYRF